MADEIAIPGAGEMLVEANRMPAASWYRIFAKLVASFNVSTRSLTSAAADISTLDGRVDGHDSDLTTLDGRVDALEAEPEPVVVVVASGALSSQATLDVPLGSLDMYEIDLINIAPATDNAVLHMLFSQSSSFLTGASDYSWGKMDAASASNDEADSEIQMATGIGNATNETGTFKVRIYRPSASTFLKTAHWTGGTRFGTPISAAHNGVGSLLANTNAIDGVRFLFSAGDIASGYYAVRGYRFSV